MTRPSVFAWTHRKRAYRIVLTSDRLWAQVPRPPYVLLNANHGLAKKKRVSLHDLANEPLILLDILPSRTYFTRLLTRIRFNMCTWFQVQQPT